jgi:5-formyltetrahydrofolate cyclo-ligase
LEFALLAIEKKIGPQTPILTTVHPLQIVDEDIPMTDHDIPLNTIVTPDETIEIRSLLPRPKGIYWRMLTQEKIDEIPVLSKPQH